MNSEEQQTNQETMDKLAISIYLSTITLNTKGLNALIKRQRVAEWITNVTHLYAAYTRFILDQNTHMKWGWKGRKDIPRK